MRDRKKLPLNIFKGKIEIVGDFEAPLPEFEEYMSTENEAQPQMNADEHR
jgi:hypothetical protein